MRNSSTIYPTSSICHSLDISRYVVQLHIRNTDIFMPFQADLYRECPFWADNGFCSNPGCSITTVDEVSNPSLDDYATLKICKSDIPEKWRAKALSEVDP